MARHVVGQQSNSEINSEGPQTGIGPGLSGYGRNLQGNPGKDKL